MTKRTVDIPLSTLDKEHDDSDSELDEQQPTSTTEEQIDPVSYLKKFMSIFHFVFLFLDSTSMVSLDVVLCKTIS
jgi:hypothetical protein